MKISLLACLWVVSVASAGCGARIEIPADDAGASDGAGTTDSGGLPDVATCEPSRCGDLPGAPAEMCWDGSTGGATGRCVQSPDGRCNWEFRNCPPAIPCATSGDCGRADLFCRVPFGACGTKGACARKPEGCDFLYAPVCGCDGRTHGNECAANTAGTTTAYKGECRGTTKVCGGSSGVTCGSGEYCRFPDGKCPAPETTGTCTAVPMGCPDLYSPVCGCDGKTYGNSCEASQARQTVAYNGSCGDAPTTSCGGRIGSTCLPSMYCDYPSGTNCGGDDSTGTCRPRPTTCSREYKPVCGCDRRTYGNACLANQAGQDIVREGPC